MGCDQVEAAQPEKARAELTDLLESEGEIDEAIEAQDEMYKILAARNVLPRVLQDIQQRKQRLSAVARPPKQGKGKSVG